MYSALCVCLDEIAKNTDMVWDGNTISEAQGLLHKISSPSFIAAFKVNHHNMFGHTKSLSILLQGSTVDVITAYNDIHIVKKVLLDMRKDPEKEFKPVFDSMLTMAQIGDSAGMPIPRRCGRQIARSNVEATTPEEYW